LKLEDLSARQMCELEVWMKAMEEKTEKGDKLENVL
jgi:hypothetical protein